MKCASLVARRGVSPSTSSSVRSPGGPPRRGGPESRAGRDLRLARTDRRRSTVDVSSSLWLAVLGGIVAMLAVDLFAHRRAHVIGVREAAAWSAVWVATGVAFGTWIW